MSIPAVLYDHVPVREDDDDEEDENKTAGVTFFVSSMVHRTSAPPEETVNGAFVLVVNGDGEPPELSDAKTNGDDRIRGAGADEKGDGDGESDADDNAPMETIIDDVDSEYVLVVVPPDVVVDDDGAFARDRTVREPSDGFRVRGEALLKRAASVLSRRPNHDGGGRTTTTTTIAAPPLGKAANEAIAKLLSSIYATGSLAALARKPLESYSRGWTTSPSICRSYDYWVSETVVDDGSGSRSLILPGACVDLGGDRGCEPSSSSRWASKTTMVSAHDLLAVEHDRRPDATEGNEKAKQPRRDGDDAHRYAIAVTMTTRTATELWIRALRKLALRETSAWQRWSRSCLRRSLRCAGRFWIGARCAWVRYCRDDARGKLLPASSSGTEHHRTTDPGSSSRKNALSDGSAQDEESSDDDDARFSEWSFLNIEMTMTTPMKKRTRNDHPVTVASEQSL